MAISLALGVTDHDRHAHLRAGTRWSDVNFWSPEPRSFRTLRPGEPFLFQAKAPVNLILGGGVFAHAADMPSSFAWEAFGEANGAPSLREMRARIARCRRDGTRGDFPFAARALVEPTFWPEETWFEPSTSFGRQIVGFEGLWHRRSEGPRALGGRGRPHRRVLRRSRRGVRPVRHATACPAPPRPRRVNDEEAFLA